MKMQTLKLKILCKSISTKRGEVVLVDKSNDVTNYYKVRNLIYIFTNINEIWKLQKSIVTGLCRNKNKKETIILAQHKPVYTLGAGSTLENFKFDTNDAPHPIYRTERGGEVTYHGPGQIVMYPILDLHNYQCDLHYYLRQLEEVVIKALKQISNINGVRISGLTGVWVHNSKLAAIGIRATKWITYHGLALNVSMDLKPFDFIIPCGIHDKYVTSVEKILNPQCDALNVDEELIKEYRYGLIDAFEEVFDVHVKQ